MDLHTAAQNAQFAGQLGRPVEVPRNPTLTERACEGLGSINELLDQARGQLGSIYSDKFGERGEPGAPEALAKAVRTNSADHLDEQLRTALGQANALLNLISDLGRAL